MLCLCLLLSGAPAVCGSGSEAHASAERLHSLGLLSGVGTLPDGSIDFGLELPLSREQAVVMLLRLIGREQESEGMELNMPFSDVSPWAAKSVAYAHSLGLAQGIAPGLFGGRDSLSAAAYLTFVLRALGYSSEDGYTIVNPSAFSSHPNPVYGFEEKTVSDLNSIEADFVPLHDWSSESFELYQLLSFSPYPEKASFAFDGKYINVPDWAREEYRK